MKIIYKYQLEVIDDLTISLPIGAEILTVQSQRDIPCIWALVDNDAIKENRKFKIIGTGNPIEDLSINNKYIGTFQLYEGSLVFHLFEIL